MIVPSQDHCDVLVIGAGIAGICAAIAAAKEGCTVVLTSSTEIFSGSSFFPGTWGLGLIGPVDAADEDDLAASIARVGAGMTTPALVKTFVHKINPAINALKARGIRLRTAEKSDEKEFIPCFDHKRRNWNGLEAARMRAVFQKELAEYGVRLCPHHEALELVQHSGRVCGAVFAVKNRLLAIRSKAVVLATGGYSGLFQNCLTTADVTGTGHALALRAGARLINMEFMQMMPAFLSPAPKTVFNEKTFRFATFRDADGNDILAHLPNRAALLAHRSTHGPFTAAGADRAVDFAIARAEQSGGAYVSYSDEMKQNPPEFIATYFDWLRENKGLTPDDPVRIGMYAHAANGGIVIGSDAATDVPSLYACGEVTGGMHGADRIGGLSSANGLVFGEIAGKSAATEARGTMAADDAILLHAHSIPDAHAIRSRLRSLMTENAMIARSADGLTRAIRFCTDALEEMERNAPATAAADAAAALRLSAQLRTATAVLTAALLRRESRGAHYRTDHPDTLKSEQKRIIVTETNGTITARHESSE